MAFDGAYISNHFRKHQSIPDNVKIDPNGLDYYSILHGIRWNRQRFGSVRILSIERSGFEGRYVCLISFDNGCITSVYDRVDLDKPPDSFLLFSEKIALKVLELCHRPAEPAKKYEQISLF